MTREKRTAFWIGGFAVFAVLLILLHSMLLPFVAGMAVAYFLDPVADRLEKWGASRTLATCLILASFFLAVIAVFLLLFPLLQGQVVAFVARIPEYIDWIRDLAEPVLQRLQAKLTEADIEKLRSAAGTFAGDAIQWITGLLKNMWSSGKAIFNVLSLVVITPLVSFYLLRDWDKIVAHIDGLLPRDNAPTIRLQMKAIDDTLSSFVRGQASVCLLLAVYYATGLSFLGLDFGLIVGIGAGVISFIPYIGASIGLAVGVGIAIAQFADWVPVVQVAAVFIVGQVTESYVLSPKMVGERVGLHPVWLIFALLAGGALFGFTGVLLAVPVAAVIGVLIRFGTERYLDSRLYHGSGGGDV